MQLDDRVGDAIERAIRAHHRRRLRRIGWEHALDAVGPAWAGGEPAPRTGNAVEVLVDGAEALPRMADITYRRRHWSPVIEEEEATWKS